MGLQPQYVVGSVSCKILLMNGYVKVRIFGEHARGIETTGSVAAGSERRVFLFPEVDLSLVNAMVVAV